MNTKLVLKWVAAAVLALPLLAVLYVALFGWNWARGPLQRAVTEKTGRALVIGGDLKVALAWPAPHVRASAVTFANPPWAKEKQMVAVDEIDFTVDLRQLFRRTLVFPEVRLTRPVVFLELAADGRRTWLLDTGQSDETARIPIGRLTLDRGRLGYDDAKQKTSVRADLSTQPGGDGVVFDAKGLYKGLALAARGSGGAVMALHDESAAYPLKVDATIGSTGVKAEGTVTSLLKYSALDMKLALRGDSLALLYPLIGVALPETHPYTTAGRLVHSGQSWRYEKFTGLIGKSDVAGFVQVITGAARPVMRGELVTKLLDFADLAPVIGARDRGAAPAAVALKAGPAGPHWLPDIPFKSERWGSVDADVTLHATKILRAKALPIENLSVHLKMQDSVLTLDPLDFGFAGGHIKSVIALDGKRTPIAAHAKVSVRKLLLAKLFPTIDLTSKSVGQVNGDFDLTGAGSSVGGMLAKADGKVALVVAQGEVSRLLMEKIGLHLLEILELSIAGDKMVKLRCGVADFGVKSGVMTTKALVLDTEVTTITGSGTINLVQERLDLVLVPKTKNTSPVALRSPIYVRGTFAKPEVDIDKARVAARGLGALALGLVNPLLALIPLIETGPGMQSECGQLIRSAQGAKPR